ncbi:hypothetical protein JW766_01595 [Candidatus Dojkabacteria bacterium]|nr:hypothetical protein [Candidatus Dojkabacteria bacterium]
MSKGDIQVITTGFRSFFRRNTDGIVFSYPDETDVYEESRALILQPFLVAIAYGVEAIPYGEVDEQLEAGQECVSEMVKSTYVPSFRVEKAKEAMAGLVKLSSKCKKRQRGVDARGFRLSPEMEVVRRLFEQDLDSFCRQFPELAIRRIFGDLMDWRMR